MEITKRLQGDVLVLEAAGKMAIGAGDVRIRDAVRDALAAGHRKLLIDMERVTMLDSSGVGELVSGYTSAVKRGGSVKLARVGRRPREVLMATQLTNVLEIFADVDSALRSFGA